MRGHFTWGRLPDGSTAPGGTSLHSSYAAQRAALVSALAEIPAALREQR
ncbi:MAG TPA: hypothetical protein VFX76_10050 [Roseiflexaceae bacterium]|nr:hypothetical protein [Roseiflexaceae bacterium]